MVDGARAAEPQFTIPAGTELASGDVFLGARAGTAAESHADAVYDTALSLLGTGVWLTDADGRRVDSVGVYAANVLDSPSVLLSPCTKRVALTTYQPDRLLEQTFQRSRFTGVDADDFVVARATPGTLDEIPWVDPTQQVAVTPDFPDGAPVTAAEAVAEPEGTAATVLEAWGGATESGPLTVLVGDAETRLDPTNPGELRDDAYGYPYQRLVLDAADMVAGSTVTWSGTGEGRSEVQLSIWTGEAWRLVGCRNGRPDDAPRSGRGARHPRSKGDPAGAERSAYRGDPGIRNRWRAGRPRRLRLRGLPHHRHPVPDRELPRGLRRNRQLDRRQQPGGKIEFATHTGDIIQNFVDPEQNDDRARREFERASAIQSILDDAGVPNSVLPGNHDNRRGVDDVAVQRVLPRRAVRRSTLVRRVARRPTTTPRTTRPLNARARCS